MSAQPARDVARGQAPNDGRGSRVKNACVRACVRKQWHDKLISILIATLAVINWRPHKLRLRMAQYGDHGGRYRD